MSRYISISKFDDANANGFSVVIFYSSCPHHCKGCQNPSTWKDKDVGELITDSVKESILKHIKDNDHIYDALVLSGGDPLCDDNILNALKISREFKELFPNKELWIYTGYEFSKIKNDITRLCILKYCDYIKCGAYKEELKTTDNIQYDIRLATSNQKIYKKGVDY